jgi:hypothetical protein
MPDLLASPVGTSPGGVDGGVREVATDGVDVGLEVTVDVDQGCLAGAVRVVLKR